MWTTFVRNFEAFFFDRSFSVQGKLPIFLSLCLEKISKGTQIKNASKRHCKCYGFGIYGSIQNVVTTPPNQQKFNSIRFMLQKKTKEFYREDVSSSPLDERSIKRPSLDCVIMWEHDDHVHPITLEIAEVVTSAIGRSFSQPLGVVPLMWSQSPVFFFFLL